MTLVFNHAISILLVGQENHNIESKNTHIEALNILTYVNSSCTTISKNEEKQIIIINNFVYKFSCVTCQMPHTICHMSHVTCNVSHVSYPMSLTRTATATDPPLLTLVLYTAGRFAQTREKLVFRGAILNYF